MLSARMGKSDAGAPLTGLEPLELQGDGVVDSFMLDGAGDAITSLADERVVAYRANRTIAPGWTPIVVEKAVVGFENGRQSLHMLSSTHPVLSTQMEKDGRLWSHSLHERHESLLVEEPCSENPEGRDAYQISFADTQARPNVCVLGGQYVEVAGSGLDGPFSEALQSREVVWQGYSSPVSSLQEAWNLSDRGLVGQQSRRVVARDSAGRWTASQEVELDTERGEASLRVVLPGPDGSKLEETLRGSFTEGRLVTESVTKTLRVRGSDESATN